MLLGEAFVTHARGYSIASGESVPDVRREALLDDWDARVQAHKYVTLIWLDAARRYAVPVRFTGPMRPSWVVDWRDKDGHIRRVVRSISSLSRAEDEVRSTLALPSEQAGDCTSGTSGFAPNGALDRETDPQVGEGYSAVGLDGRALETEGIADADTARMAMPADGEHVQGLDTVTAAPSPEARGGLIAGPTPAGDTVPTEAAGLDVERGDAAAGGVGTAVAPHRYVLLSPDAIFLASPADYCRHVVACYLQRVPISGADRLPQASALWEKCRVELGDAEEMPPDIPDERWIDFISLLERTGRVKKVWPEIATRRKERKNCAKLADAILDTRLTASALGLAENECPACRECDDTMKHFGGDGGKAKWKHFRGHCGDGGGPAKMAELVLGKDGAAAFLSDQVGEQTPAPPEWPQEDMSRVSDDPDEEEDDEEGAPAEPKKAWYGPAHVARAWEACRSLDELPEYRPGMRVELAGSALT